MKISFLDIVSWIVVRSSTKIIYSSSFGEMVRMGTGSLQIVLDLIWRKKKGKEKKENLKKKLPKINTRQKETDQSNLCLI